MLLTETVQESTGRRIFCFQFVLLSSQSCDGCIWHIVAQSALPGFGEFCANPLSSLRSTPSFPRKPRHMTLDLRPGSGCVNLSTNVHGPVGDSVFIALLLINFGKTTARTANPGWGGRDHFKTVGGLQRRHVAPVCRERKGGEGLYVCMYRVDQMEFS